MKRFEHRVASRTLLVGRSSGWTCVVNLWFERDHAPTASIYLEDQPDGSVRMERSSTASGARNPVGAPW